MGGRGCVSSACSGNGWGSGARLAPLGGARGWDKEELVNHTFMMITCGLGCIQVNQLRVSAVRPWIRFIRRL